MAISAPKVMVMPRGPRPPRRAELGDDARWGISGRAKKETEAQELAARHKSPGRN